MSIWAEKRKSLYNEGGLMWMKTVSAKKLQELSFQDKIKLCYDPETPETVVKVFLNDKDASVMLAARQRPAVLRGSLKNPFTQE